MGGDHGYPRCLSERSRGPSPGQAGAQGAGGGGYRGRDRPFGDFHRHRKAFLERHDAALSGDGLSAGAGLRGRRRGGRGRGGHGLSPRRSRVRPGSRLLRGGAWPLWRRGGAAGDVGRPGDADRFGDGPGGGTAGARRDRPPRDGGAGPGGAGPDRGPRRAGPAAGAADHRRRSAGTHRVGDRAGPSRRRAGLRGDRPRRGHAPRLSRDLRRLGQCRDPRRPDRAHRPRRRDRAGGVLSRRAELCLSARLHEGGAAARGGRMGARRPCGGARPDRDRRAVARRSHHPPGAGRGGPGRLSHGLRRPRLPENDTQLEGRSVKDDVPNLKEFDQRLRDEAHEDLADVINDGEPTQKTQIIAIYGKGGIGKSFTLANLSHMMAEQQRGGVGFRVASDQQHALALLGHHETSTRKNLAGEPVKIGDVCFKRGGVFAMELGGPEVGRGCGGRGIIHGFELLEKLGFHDWDFDYVLLDFLGDVVCGGFGLPIARDMAQKVILVASNDLQSLYVANNVCSAVEYFRKLGGNVGVAGLVVNKDDHSGEAQAFAKAVDIPILAAIPQDDDLRKKSANYQIVGTSKSQRGDLFAGLAEEVAVAPPVRPAPLDQDGLLGLFDSKDTGGDVVLEPATDQDMRGKNAKPKKSLEVVYDDV